MPLKLTCPHCGHPTRLAEPLPLPGAEIQCETCGQGLAVSYPDGVVDQLRKRGKAFQSEASALPRPPKAPPPPSPHRELGTSVPTTIDRTTIDRTVPFDDGFGGSAPSYAELDDRTVPSSRTPYGQLAGNADEPESVRPLSAKLAEAPVIEDEPEDDDSDAATNDIVPSMSTLNPSKANRKPAASSGGAPPAKKVAAKPARRGCFAKLAALGTMGGLATVALVLLGGAGTFGGGYWYFSRDLPSTETLQAYEPPTVTVVYDKNGKVLGEIYEERRYVIPLEEIPKHVQDAFVSAEDAAFWTHGGIDYPGLARAFARAAMAGKSPSGTSTITQQVTRNFLLSNEKSIPRKAKEMILAGRIESVYDKEHILWLYLNEIYLGSSAYGVEAAARVYFGKHASELTVAEGAMIAGLPPAPSAYSPHKNLDSARVRQRYVLDQMVKNGYLTNAEADAAYAEELKIVERGNEFLEQAPYFTEYVRRYVVDKYGEDRVLREGLQVTTTCDLDLQKHAQTVLTAGVDDVDQRMGFRRAGLETLKGDDAIAKRRQENEAALRKAWAKEQDPAGRVPEPEKSVLVPDRVYEAVILEVDKRWARVGIGDHEAVVPMGWSDWVYQPDPKRSWRHRDAVDLTAAYDDDGDGKKDGPTLRKGDVVQVKVVGLSTKDKAVAKEFKKTPGEASDLVAVRLWQTPEVEATMMSFDLETGAVRAMVGGADFRRSQFNRATQALRQVGSTFKPIVYGAAIDSRKVTSASVVTDAPLAFATDQEFVWKPGNYSNDYEGNMTLRRALALSKNTCTVRVLESIDPGMNEDVVYKFARKLGIGGPPLHELPPDHVTSPDNDHLCPWTVEQTESTICMDHYPPRTDTDLSNTAHRRALTPEDRHECRSCDFSMALGSASLTMEELLRAYSAFGTGGHLVEPYYVEEVRDRDGNVLEKHEPVEFPQVIDPAVASIVNWLMQSVVNEGTAAEASKLGLHLAGKTGTTNDEKDAWFVGMTTQIVTGVWVGYDQPRTLGVSSTGGRTALPIWTDYMKVAAPKETKEPFPMLGEIEWAQIDEETGRRVTSGGRSYPFLKDTAPEATGVAAGQKTVDDLVTDM